MAVSTTPKETGGQPNTGVERLSVRSGREQIIEALRQALPVALEPFPQVRLAYLFGSVARGQACPWSDVDVAVVLGRPLPPLGRLDLELELELAILDATGLDEVDVRTMEGAPLLVQGAVVTEGALLFARDETERIAYETSTRSRYFDYLPSARAMAATFGEALRKRLADTPPTPGPEWPA